MVKALVIACVVTAAVAAADDGARTLLSAERSVEDVDYEAARALIERALQSGSLQREELQRAYVFAGIVAAALDSKDEALDRFERALVLGPVKLPSGLAPRITQAFDRAVQAARLLTEARYEVLVSRDGDRVKLTADADPMRLVKRMRARLGVGRGAEQPGNSITVAVPSAGPVRITVDLLDEHGNQIARRRVEVAPPDLPRTETLHRIPVPLRWYTWAGATLIAGSGAGWYAWRAREDQRRFDALRENSAQHTFGAAEEVAARGRREARLANILLGVTGVLAAAAVVTLAVDTYTIEVRPTASHDHAEIQASLRF